MRTVILSNLIIFEILYWRGKVKTRMGEMKYGIWAGKFQIIQRGHEQVMVYVSEKYQQVCIGIINPDPKRLMWDNLQYERMCKKNPFTYFQRAYLWNKLLRHHSTIAVIVPYWQPRLSLKFESTFLPIGSREWILPLFPGIDEKREDLEKQGEIVHIYQAEPPELRDIYTSDVRQSLNDRNNKYTDYMPKIIQRQTIKFLTDRTIDKQFLIVPLLGD